MKEECGLRQSDSSCGLVVTESTVSAWVNSALPRLPVVEARLLSSL